MNHKWISGIAGSLMFLLATVPNNAWGQTQDICRSLLQYGTFDSTDSYTDKQRYNLTRHAVCNSNIETYRQARAFEQSGGIDIIDLISAEGQGAVTEQNYRERRSLFCSKDFAQAWSTDEVVQRTRRASRTLATNFVDCLSRVSGLAGIVTQSRNKESFTISIVYNVASGGENDFNVTQVSAQPVEIECRQMEHLASEQNPIRSVGSRLMNCINKSPEKSFLLAVSTNRGTIRGVSGGGIELLGTADTISDLTDRLQRVESRVVMSGTISFFQLSDCPDGWRDAPELSGRYVVGLQSGGTLGAQVGQALSNQENRPTGKHHHTFIDGRVQHNSACQRKYEGIAADFRSGSPTALCNNDSRTAEFGVEGTNAPYIQLRACRKQ